MSVSTKSKTFEFWSISLWEGIIVFQLLIHIHNKDFKKSNQCKLSVKIAIK